MKLSCSTIVPLPLLLACLSHAQYSNSTSNTTVPTIDLGYVKYTGYQNATAGINYYRGIPYAQPPVGDLRWRKTRPIEASNNFSGATIAVDRIAPACYQSVPLWDYLPATFNATGFVNTPQGQSEDCLILDILVPSNPVSSSLPVMVQIHGGGYTSGNAAYSYPGDAMVNFSNGTMIYISIQYRLGLFGFLGGSEVSQDGTLNAGLLDQRAALDWIQRNIRAFGGDPSKVTIWGGSAGGGSVTYQLIAGGGYDDPPFSAAIAEYPWWQPLLNASTQERQYFTALQLSGCADLNCLRSLPAQTLQTLNQADQNSSYNGPGDGYGTYWYGPVVDGRFVRRLPDQEFKTGNFYKVPLIIDHDGYEGDRFSNKSQTTQTAETIDAMDLFPYAGPSFFSRLYQLYPMSSYNSTFFQRQTWYGDFIINCPTYYMATAMSDHAYNTSAVFKLIFDAGSELHGATTVFLAANSTGWPAANNHTLAEIMSSYWISFAVTQDPNPMRIPSAPFWPSYISGGNGSVANGESVGFDTLGVTYTTISVEEDPDASAQCDFFSSQGYQVRN